jgi:hypothetical protein
LIAALDGVFIGENFAASQSYLGKPQPAIFRQVPAFQWKQPSGLVITVIVARDGSITLVNETSATTDDPTGLALEDSRISGLMFNKDTHQSIALQAPATACTGSAGTECWDYHYDRGVVMRAEFAPDGQGDKVLREVTLAQPSLLQQLHIGE